MGILTALIVKDIKQLLRDPRSLVMVLLMPILVMFMFAAGYGEERGGVVPVAVVNLDGGVVSWQFIEALRESGNFRFVGFSPTKEGGVEMVRRGEAYATIIIPQGFSNSVIAGKSTRLVIVLDASYATVSEIVWQAVAIAVQQFMKVASEKYSTFNIDVMRETVYGPKVSNLDTFTSVVMGVLLHLVPMSLIAVSISRERERRTFEQLIMTPITSAHIVIGKLLAYSIMTVLDMLITLSLSVLLLGVSVRGPLIDLTLVSLLLLICSLSLGLLISAVSRNQLQAYQASIFFFIPSMLFSGFFMPVELLSPFAQTVGKFLPMYYFIRAFKSIQLRGWTLRDVSQDCAILAGEMFLFLVAAIRVLRLRVE
ncbi:MAG: ABC transporter permease [Thermofilaceae archaeon]